MQIISNYQPRELISFAELNPKEIGEFDYITEEDFYAPRFFRYRGKVYDSAEFQLIQRRRSIFKAVQVIDNDSPLFAWSAIEADSFFSGVLLRYTDDFEQVIIGRYYS
jgi:hypothetical protein